jgi:enterobactin synthetase component D
METDLTPASALPPAAGAATDGRRDGARVDAAVDRVRACLPPDLAPVVAWHAVSFAGPAPFGGLDERLPGALQAASPKRRTEYLAGRYCAQQALARAGADGDTWVARGGDELPAWPPGWLGSISHTRDGAVAAVARRTHCHVLGVDMERIVGEDQLEALRRLVVLPGERELLDALSAPPALTLLFSAKEALYKALYPQVREFFDFSAARAVAFDPRVLTLQLTQAWGAGWPRGRRVRVHYVFDEAKVFTVACEAAQA